MAFPAAMDQGLAGEAQTRIATMNRPKPIAEEPARTFPITRPSGTTEHQLKVAYARLRGMSVSSAQLDRALSRSNAAIQRAAEFVEARGADPHEFMRILFLSSPGKYPYAMAVGSEWALSTYDEMFQGGPSMGLKKFLLEKDKLSAMVLSMGMPLADAICLDDFSSVSKVVHCSDESLPEMLREHGREAAERLKWDRDLKNHVLENYGPRSARAFQQTLAVEPPESPVEVGPRQAASRQRGNIPN